MSTREVYTGTGSLAGRRRVRNGLRLHGLVLTAVYGRLVTVGSYLCMLRSAPVPRAALLVSHSYCISRNICVRRRAIGVGHGDSVACAGQRAVGAGRVTAHPS